MCTLGILIDFIILWNNEASEIGYEFRHRNTAAACSRSFQSHTIVSPEVSHTTIEYLSHRSRFCVHRIDYQSSICE